MSIVRFEISREDGRSNQQVIIDHVSREDPGKLFTYTELAEALNEGADRSFEKPDVQSAVNAAKSRLLKEHQRALSNVRGTGYKLAHATEHVVLAGDHRRRADRQFSKGLGVLRNVRWNEMDEVSRTAHQGTLMITESIYANQQALEKQQNAQAKAIHALTQRVDHLAPTLTEGEEG